MKREAGRGTVMMVERQNAEARRLTAKGRLREALNTLNDAIYSTPGYPHLYATRAIVFDRLGMYPQAEADRERALNLAREGGYTEEEVFAAPVPLERSPRAAQRPPALPRVSVPRVSIPRVDMPHVEIPRVTLPPPGSRAELGVILAAIGGLAAIVLVLFVIGSALGDSNVDLNIFDFQSFQEAQPSPEASPAAATPAASATPPPETPPPEALAGSPFSFASLQNAWQGKGLTVAPGAISGGFNGFKKAAFDVNVAHTGGNASLSVLLYGSPDEPKEDWDLPAGSRPAPKEGRSLPAHETIWWNSNAIVVVRNSSGDANNTALDAFLNASP
jgi:hypothetical protein